jgi:hypothetical protein
MPGLTKAALPACPPACHCEQMQILRGTMIKQVERAMPFHELYCNLQRTQQVDLHISQNKTSGPSHSVLHQCLFSGECVTTSLIN